MDGCPDYRYFEIHGPSDNEKVQCASFVLNADARFWCETVEAMRNVNEMTWAQFIEEFNKKFYNHSMMKEYQNELSNIK